MSEAALGGQGEVTCRVKVLSCLLSLFHDPVVYETYLLVVRSHDDHPSELAGLVAVLAVPLALLVVALLVAVAVPDEDSLAARSALPALGIDLARLGLLTRVASCQGSEVQRERAPENEDGSDGRQLLRLSPSPSLSLSHSFARSCTMLSPGVGPFAPVKQSKIGALAGN